MEISRCVCVKESASERAMAKSDRFTLHGSPFLLNDHRSSLHFDTAHIHSHQIEVFCEAVPKTAEVSPVPTLFPSRQQARRPTNKCTNVSFILPHQELSRIMCKWGLRRLSFPPVGITQYLWTAGSHPYHHPHRNIKTFMIQTGDPTGALNLAFRLSPCKLNYIIPVRHVTH